MAAAAAASAGGSRASLDELAAVCGAAVVGDGARRISRVRTLDAADAADLSFLTSGSYLEAARRSRAGALLVGPAHRGEFGDRDLLVADDPYLALASILGWLHPLARPAAGVHPTAVVGERCEIAASATVGPYCVLGDDVEVGERVWLESHVDVGSRCVIGEDAWLHPQVVLYPGTVLGQSVEVHSGVVLGADGFGFASEGARPVKLPQVGRVRLGDRVEIGANSAIDRATLEDTVVGEDTKIDNLVQVGHNVQIGAGSILCGQAGIAGSARLGRGVVLAGQSGVGGHLEVGDGVRVGAAAAVLGSVAAGETVCGVPAIPMSRWRRSAAVYARLDELRKRVGALQREVDRLVSGSGDEAATGERSD
ncbi:MAG: UDP-3-O-(3-hydroxymyristoyl)glucosamine N-acyltransferase [Acidobacteria bacterium]|nr:MAG: UDP-3-O-(3-hydroxymyristoyl)glucosamine N-acyltransferase [Acidobacteriota bacterium]REK04318.1 MAG: UDP-3-O-(3-hydroxymyristoyl)glucosamine N-acyltransferase [Acidobacteriota bacterium]